LDLKYLDFASNLQNRLLVLTIDDFNTFGHFRNSYTIWPLVLILYNKLYSLNHNS